ncbi:MAG: hypothetical protein ACP5QK_08100 [Myxococcota bacterium]
MENERKNNVEMISDVIKNGFEASLNIASKHYHLITDLQQLLLEKEKIFKMLGEQVFQMIDQGRIFVPAIMQATFKAAKEVIERISLLEEERKNRKEVAKNIPIKATNNKAQKVNESSGEKRSNVKIQSKSKPSNGKVIKNKISMKKKK